MRLFVLLLVMLGFAGAASAAGTYDLLFHKGSLSGLDAPPPAGVGKQPPDTLLYDRVLSAGKKGEAPDSDNIGLQLTGDDNVALILRQGPRMRSLGNFPASVGNPLIMYFLESTLSDIAAQSGGSPFYIRNRIKEALLKDAEIVPVSVQLGDRDIAAQRVTLHPLEKDKARARMGRFAELALSVVVSEEVPGWLYSLEATVPEGQGAEDAGYRNVITLTDKGEAKP
ncbi:hypothetical protein ACFFP0_01185 [Rhizobium puerariae]|uniref:Uncharacterized protein n=1 Tax=Rhizobium puerariae TaxID=1585791 RepID=A0ABV6AC74_9HYPH